tara:strand:+ start:650 stop:832 length:183 start_codon:yes stop_codon:yes gene_type:complete
MPNTELDKCIDEYYKNDRERIELLEVMLIYTQETEETDKRQNAVAELFQQYPKAHKIICG